MGAPAGLKLHAELSSLLGSAALALLRVTRACYAALAPALLPQLLGGTALAARGCLGHRGVASSTPLFWPIRASDARQNAHSRLLPAAPLPQERKEELISHTPNLKTPAPTA